MNDDQHTATATERAEALYRERLEAAGVPFHLHAGLIRYLVHRIRPGHFLIAVLADDQTEACARADEHSAAGLPKLRRFLMTTAPANSWGSYAVLERWLDRDELGLTDAANSNDAANTLHGGER